MNEIEKSILKTIIYFDLFEYPLTSFEIWKWLIQYKCDLYDILICLENSENLKRFIETRNGFYFLKGRKNIIEIRKLRRDISVLKWKKAMKMTRVLRFIPFIKMISICNAMGQFNLKEYSDIDFFIVIKKGYIWITRLFISITLQIFGLRRHRNKINNRACLSFYITDDNLDLKYVSYENDIHFYYWIINMVPIFDNKDNYDKFIESNNWINEFIPNFISKKTSSAWRINDNYLSKNIRNIKELILDNKFGQFINKLCKIFEMKRILSHKNSKYYMNSKDVVVSDNILKFHEKDLRIYYRDMFLNRISKI